MSLPRPGGRAGPGRRVLARARALLVLLAAAALGILTTAPATATTEDRPGLEVEITAVGPAVLRPGQALTVRGTVTNTTGLDLPAVQLSMRMQRSTPISRNALRRWFEADSRSSTLLLHRGELDAVPAGETVPFTITVEEPPLVPSQFSWGPRGIEVTAATAELVGSDRSALIWYPDLELEPMPVSVLLPMAATSNELAAADAGDLPAGEVAAPRLLALLGAADVPGVTTVVDPMLVGAPEEPPAAEPGEEATEGETPDEEPTAAPTATETPTSGPTPTPDADRSASADARPPAAGGATATPTTGPTAAPTPGRTAGPDPTDGQVSAPEGAAAELLAALTAREDDAQGLALLPWADADVAALAHAGQPDLVATARERATDAADDLGLDAGGVLSWPVADRPDQATVTAAVESGADAVVLPSGVVSPLLELTYTPSGRADLELDGTTVATAVVDEPASQILADGPTEDLDAVDVRQLLLADTAVMFRERPADPRALVLALPRDAGGDDAALAALGPALEALTSAPWVEPTSLSGILDLPAPRLDRDTLPDRVVEDGELGARDLDAMREIRSEVMSFATILAEPQVLVAPVQDALGRLLSAAWREDPAARTLVRERLAAEVAALDTLVAALPSSTVNVINSSAQLPVHVRNDLDREVTVQVRLDPSDQRLQARETVTVTVPADGQATAQVPVRAVGSGDVPVAVELLTPEGRPVGTSTDLHVRVRADWESVGTAVVAGAFGVMLVVGLVRTVRRHRRAAAAAEAGTPLHGTAQAGRGGAPDPGDPEVLP